MLGLFDRLKPRFVKTFANVGQNILDALITYKNEVENRSFPDLEHSTEMSEDEWNDLLSNLS